MAVPATTADTERVTDRAVVDELRGIAPGIALGPVLLHGRVLGWFGLERS